MRHRSVVLFIVLAASLAAAPQASQELAALRSAVGERVRAEIWNAFLSLHAQGREKILVPPGLRPAVASPESPKGGAELATKANACDAGRAAETKRKESPSRRAERESARMITDPALDPSKVKVALVRGKGAADSVRQVLRLIPQLESAPAGDFAMLVPPGTGVGLPALTSAARGASGLQGDAWPRGPNAAELQRHAAQLAAQYGSRGPAAKRVREEIRLQFDGYLNFEGQPKGKSREPYFRVMKVKTPNKVRESAPAAPPARPGKQIACSGLEGAGAVPAAE